MPTDPTRRDFVRTSAATAAFGLFAAGCATTGTTRAGDGHAGDGQAAAPAPAQAKPTEPGTLRLGMIGFGVRARELHGEFLDDERVAIVAVADAAAARAAEGVRLVNARRGEGACVVVPSWRAIVADPSIDAVVISTPDHWHAEPAIAAALAGKHVYCEKPLSLTVAEGRAIANAARAAGVVFQTGSQQRSEFGYHFVRAAEAVRNGRIGKVTRITIGVGEPPIACDLPEEPLPEGIDWDAWLGQAPLRPFNHELCPIGVHNRYPKWRHYREYANGGLADMGAHHFDIAQWALEMDASGPREVIPPADGAKTGLRFVYADGTEMIHGGPTDCTFFGTLGTIECSRGHVRAYRGIDRAAPDAPELLAPPAAGERSLPRNRSHIADFLDAIRTGSATVADAEVGHRTATICQLCNIGYEVGKPLAWDPVTERFAGANAELGNALLARRVRPHA